jgi:hypothetical protein
MIRFRLLAAVAALSIAATAPATAKVDVIQSSSPALARGKAFAWAPVPARGFGLPDPSIANEVTAERLRVLTEVTLANKGFRQVDDAGKADLLAAYTIVIVPDVEASLGAHGPSMEMTHHTQGTLVLDLIERESGRLVWRATSEKRITGKDVSQEKLTALVRKMTRSLPSK